MRCHLVRFQRVLHQALQALTQGARGQGNLLELSVNAARAKATVGEISLALEKVFGRHKASIKAISGVYRREVGEANDMARHVESQIAAFRENEGRPPRVLLAIADQMRRALPRVIGDYPLLQAWGFKYDQRLQGINMHADFAKVNVNFWITPDEANLDPASGGLILWDKESPSDWPFNEYNNPGPMVHKFLKEGGAKAIRVPYKANRAIIFNSALFHQTDDIHFRDTYEDRRVNITLLYGRKLRATADAGF